MNIINSYSKEFSSLTSDLNKSIQCSLVKRGLFPGDKNHYILPFGILPQREPLFKEGIFAWAKGELALFFGNGITFHCQQYKKDRKVIPIFCVCNEMNSELWITEE